MHPTSFDRWAAPWLRRHWRRWTVYRGRRWTAVLIDCDLVRDNRRTGQLLVPRVLRLRCATRSIDTLYVRMARGQDLHVWTEKADALAAALFAHRVAITKVRPAVLAVVVEREMPFDRIIPAPDIPGDPRRIAFDRAAGAAQRATRPAVEHIAVAFTLRPQDDAVPDNVAHALAWLERNTHEVGDLAKPAVARTLLDGLGTTQDGRTAAPATVQRQRAVVVNLAEYAMERRLLSENPITALPRKAPKIAQAVDRRIVVNPAQARALLDAVAAEKPSGDRLVAFFGAMYYAALRPAEAMTLRKVNLALPDEGWGELLLDSSSPVAGAPWTDSGQRREERNTALGVRRGSSPARPL